MDIQNALAASHLHKRVRIKNGPFLFCFNAIKLNYAHRN